MYFCHTIACSFKKNEPVYNTRTYIYSFRYIQKRSGRMNLSTFFKKNPIRATERPGRSVALSLGAISLLTQTMLLRRLFFNFEAGEISIGIFFFSWLFFSGLGAVARLKNISPKTGRFLFYLYPVLCLFTYVLFVFYKQILGMESWQTMHTFSSILFLLIAPSLASFFTGYIFVDISRQTGTTTETYTVESLGSLISGVIISFMIILLSGHSGCTPYAKYSITENNTQTIIHENSRILTVLPDSSESDKLAAILMTQAPDAASVLLTGKKSLPLIPGLLKYRQLTNVTYIENDSFYFKLIKHLIPEDNRLNIILSTERSYLNNNDRLFDIIYSSNDSPSLLSSNAFYTTDFFGSIKKHLNKNGVFIFNVTAEENLIRGNLADYTASAFFTAKYIFNNIQIIPAKTSIYIASDNDAISVSPEILIQRYSLIKPADSQFPENGFYSIINRHRIIFLKQLLDSYNSTSTHFINSDNQPLLYVFNNKIMLDKSGFTLNIKRFLWPSLLILLFTIIYSATSLSNISRMFQFTSGFCSFAAYLIILYSFQSRFGLLFSSIGALTGLYMAGLTCGSIIMNFFLKKDFKVKSALFLISSAQAVFLLSIPDISIIENNTVLFFVYIFLFFFCGFIGGSSYPVCSSMTGPAALAILDHWGGALASALTVLLLIPCLGISITLYILAALTLAIVICLINLKIKILPILIVFFLICLPFITHRSPIMQATGFGGTIKLDVKTDPLNRIKTIEILQHNETPEYITGISSYLKQFIGRKLNSDYSDIDAMSGATITSNAVKKALGDGRQQKFSLTPAGLIISIQHIFSFFNSPAVIANNIFILIILILTLLSGRIYCGYICPYGIMQQLAASVPVRIRLNPEVIQLFKHMPAALLLLAITCFIFSPDTAMNLKEPLSGIFSPDKVSKIKLFAIYVLILSIFMPRFWCAYFCPSGAMFKIISRISLMQTKWIRIGKKAEKELSLPQWLQYMLPAGTLLIMIIINIPHKHQDHANAAAHSTLLQQTPANRPMRTAPIEKINLMIKSGKLSDHEAMYYDIPKRDIKS